MSKINNLHDNDFPAPVFVVGMNGSGTTMLGDSLGKHPDLYIFPKETKVLPFYIKQLKRFGDLRGLPARRQLADDIGARNAFWRENGKPLVLSDEELRIPGFQGVLHAVYGHFANKCNKARWGEHTPQYLQHIRLLAEQIPNAQFIHIYRDGRDVARSFKRRWPNEPRRTIYRWKKTIQSGREQGQKLGSHRYCEVCYEDITENPEAEMRRISDFLSLQFHPAMLKSSMPWLTEQVEDEGTITPNSGKWKNYFSVKERVNLERISGKLLSELGYKDVETLGDEDPPQYRLRWWTIKDSFNYAKRFFQIYGFKSWYYLFKHLRDGMVQAQSNRY